MKAIQARRFAALLVLLFALAGCGRSGEKDAGAGPPLITASLDPGASYDLSRQIADEFERKAGVRVRLLRGAADATERLSQYLQVLGAGSPDIDVFQIDVIWPSTLSSHLIDLKGAFASDLAGFFPVLVENNTVDGRLLAVPWFGDAGLLYYRRDLIEKYGFAGPPATWEELDSMAARIQAGEREGGRPDFWGFVWQGKAYEGLTCNALEWQASSGGGVVVERDGRVSVNNPAAAAALKRAAGWVGRISPPGVTTYAEEEGRQLFQGGNAAFMRNWPYAWGLLEGEGSAAKGRTGVARLPSGGAGSGSSAAALGGWQLAVSRYSVHQTQAVEFVRYLTSREVQLRRALKLSQLPTRLDLYDDPALRDAMPILPLMKEVFLGATARPSSQTGDDYNEVSTYYFQAVHKILTGQQTASRALADLEETLKEILE